MKLFGGNSKKNSQRTNRGSAPRKQETSHLNKAQDGNNRNKANQIPNEPPKKKRRGRGWLIALLVIALLVGAGVIYWTVTTKPPEIAEPPQEEQGTDEVQIVDTPERELGRYYTVLVVGEDQLKANTDTIMVARYDAVEKKADVVSIPRDTVVNVPWSVKKINTVYYQGGEGIQSLMDEVEKVMGFRPDNYVVVQMDVFEKVIDAMGGVWFDVPVDMNYEDYTLLGNGDSYEFTINVDKGYQLLKGYDALGVFRFRQNNNGTGYAGGDLDRLETQHALIKAIADQALKLNNLPKLYNIAQIVLENSETDLTIGNLQWYAKQFFSMSSENISISTMPTTGSWINGLAYVTINVDDWFTMVNEKLNPMKNPIKLEDCSILCQKAPEPGQHSFTPENYYTTDGEEVYTNFYKNNK